ncbi:MAG: glycoside hydrolase [Gammaproteobacteria bacterium]|nr:glycoside hydrolase [Gammaproteobacteria bacterium]
MKVERQFSIEPKKSGRYSAFPTLICHGDRIWMACRQGVTPSKTPHGDGGKIYFYFGDGGTENRWQRVPVFFNQTHTLPNDLDAILSGPFDGQCVLVSRHYRNNQENVPYISIFDASRLDEATHGKSPLILNRRPINSLIDRRNGGVLVAAVYGHVRLIDTGEWLMSSYATVEGDIMHSPVILGSQDRGNSWYIKSVIVHSDALKKYLNENTFVQMSNGKWIAVIRAEAKPNPLYFAISESGMTDWLPVQETGLHGHSPVLIKGGDRPVLLYRDLDNHQPAISAAEYCDGVWKRICVLAEYENLYNGGYADALIAPDGKLFSAAYMDDDEAFPWIEGFRFELGG